MSARGCRGSFRFSLCRLPGLFMRHRCGRTIKTLHRERAILIRRDRAAASVDELRRQNEDLQEQITTLTAELAKLKELNADRSKIGDLQSRCTPVQVSGGDAALRDSLLLSGGTMQGLHENMPVICPEGVVGRLTNVGIDASRVQLITDKGVMVTVSFVRRGEGRRRQGTDGHAARCDVSQVRSNRHRPGRWQNARQESQVARSQSKCESK